MIIEYMLMGLGIMMNLITVLIVFRVLLPNKAPMDASNRINHIRIIWWAINSPERFVSDFKWLKKDEGDNVNG